MDLNEVAIFIHNYNIGDYASIFGLITAIVGFIITITTLFKTKKASDFASLAVNNMRNDLKKVDTVANLSSALTEMEEIKRLHREKKVNQLPEKYSKLKKALIIIKSSNSALSAPDSTIFQGAIAQLSSSEKALDKAFEQTQSNQHSISKFNGAISIHMDKLQEVLIKIQLSIGENNELPKNS